MSCVARFSVLLITGLILGMMAVPAWAAGEIACTGIGPWDLYALAGPPPWSPQIVGTVRSAAKEGCAFAQTLLGLASDLGHGVPQNQAKAAYWYRLAAKQGEAEAQYNLGYLYDSGQGVPQDHAKAAYWYRLAAKQGEAEAQNNLGYLYDSGQGVPQDHAKAAYWYRLAAKQGDAEAHNNLGALYHSGQGVPQDYATAAYWYRLAAKQGDVEAQYNLGFAYLLGWGLPRDFVEAYMWLNLAAAQGKKRAAKELDLISSSMTLSQIAEAQRRSAEWRPSTTSAPPSQAARPAAGDLGSGFFVTATGLVLTNAHVVDRCRAITVGTGQQSSVGRLVARDTTNDLALIATGLRPGTVAALRPRIQQGDAIAVYGFPLPGLLAPSGNATFGNITALAGPADDSRLMQISAPVQPGNSGGPVLDASGNVVGIVVAKLDALSIAAVTADIPQNVNFAIKGTIIADFLEAQGVAFTQGAHGKSLSSEALADDAKGFSVQITCNR